MKFSKRTVSVFNGATKRNGGHSQWMSRLPGFDYLIIEIGLWKPTYDHFWYDGQHHTLCLGVLRFFWGGKPILDTP